MTEQKSKSMLALMEQSIMILVFAFVAALCVMIFVKSEKLSQKLSERDMAVNRCQTAAETVKALKGDFRNTADVLGGVVNGNDLLVYYNRNWELVAETQAVYILKISREETDGYLIKGMVVLENAATEEIFALPVSWQREVSDE